MMHTVTYNAAEINFRPASVLEEIYQNINTIISTYKFTVPLNRGFGLDASFIDSPMSVIHPIYVAEIIETVEKYESRVIVEEVQMKVNLEGQVYPVISFRLREGGWLNG